MGTLPAGPGTMPAWQASGGVEDVGAALAVALMNLTVLDKCSLWTALVTYRTKFN